jgi:hypothetical protein
MKKTKKTPNEIREGIMKIGLVALLFTLVLFLFLFLFGMEADVEGVTFLAAGVLSVAAPTGSPIPGQTLTTDAASDASPNLLSDSHSKKVTKMWPSRTPIGTIMRDVGFSGHLVGENGTGAYIHRFASIDYRPIMTTTTSAYAAGTNQRAVNITVENIKMFTKDDTLKPIFVTPTAAQKGYQYDMNGETQIGDLQLVVLNVNYGTNTITVQATNGRRASLSDATTVYVPAIPSGTKLVRLATALSELDSQTGNYLDVPTDTFNYIQTHGAQFEITPEYLQHFKEIDWDKSVIMERKVRELLESEERNLLFGERSVFADAVELDSKFTMGGLWSGISADGNVFTYTAATGFTRQMYISMMRQLFAHNSGDNVRYGFIGSGFAERLSNIEEYTKYSSDAKPARYFGMTFKGFMTNFGIVNTMYHPMLDLCGHEDDAIILDISNLSLARWGQMERHEYDLRPMGKNAFANVIKEKITLELRYPQAHMIVKAV